MPRFQIGAGARDHVADVDRLAGLRIGDQAIVREGVLAVEYAGQRVRGAGERGMRGDVVDALAFEPQPTLRAGSALAGLDQDDRF